MKHLFEVLAITLFNLLLFPFIAEAHPGVGIVADRPGNIYYTDLKNVYKITPDGEKSIAVANVHTHELAIDSAGNLYGEHLWYTGETDNRWRRYVWKYTPEGKLTRVLGEHAAFQNNFGFVRDGAFNDYSARREGDRFVFRKTNPARPVTNTIGERQLNDVQWLMSDSDGTLYFSENDGLWRLSTDGTFKMLAANLAEPASPFSVFGKNRSIFGIWLDSLKNVYVALHTSGLIKKIDTGGNVSTVSKSPLGWSPVGGRFDRAGNLWVLESTFTGGMRARKVAVKEVCSGQVPASEAAWGAGAILLLVLLGLGIKRLW